MVVKAGLSLSKLHAKINIKSRYFKDIHLYFTDEILYYIRDKTRDFIDKLKDF